MLKVRDFFSSSPVILKLLTASGLALVCYGCGGKTKTREISTPPQRAGSSLSPINLRYTDTRPDISADGTKIVFVSGRDATDGVAVRKVYKVDWPTQERPGTPSRVTTEDLGSELEVAISPNGQWLAVVAVQSGTFQIYLVKYDGSMAAVRIEDSGKLKSAPRFSPDSALLAWLSTDSQGLGVAKAIALGSGAAPLPEPSTLGAALGSAKTVFWAEPASGYQLVLGATPETKGSITFSTLEFSSLVASAQATPTTLLANVLMPKFFEGAASASKVYIGRVPSISEGKQVDRIGDVEVTAEAPAPKASVISEGVALNLAGGEESSLTSTPGTQLLSVSVGTDAVFATARFFYGCKDEDSATGSGIQVNSNDGSTPAIYVPKLTSGAADKELTFGVAVGFCDRLKNAEKPEEGKFRLDDRINRAVVSRSSTATQMRVIYESRFSNRFDVACRLKTGDDEIMALEVTADAKNIYPVSNNRAPLTDTAGATGCAL